MATKTKYSYLDRIMTAVTFAEAGEYQTAKSLLGDETRKEQRPEARKENRPSIGL
ncbi:MAG: hypothetical protein V1706_09060 [Pseudomonadota bacterium]